MLTFKGSYIPYVKYEVKKRGKNVFKGVVHENKYYKITQL